VKRLSINIKGGATFGKWAPTEPYLRLITFRVLDKMGFRIAIDVQRHGFYPKGGARALLTIEPPEKLKPINLVERGEIKSITVESLASIHLRGKMVAERMVNGLSRILKQSHSDLKLKVESRYVDAASPGCGIAAFCTTSTGVILGADAIGELKVTAEKVGARAAELLLEEMDSQATCDRFASDQLIPFMSLAGDSTIIVQEITSHTRTNIELVSMFLGKRFEIEKLATGGGYIIHVT
jgi:RNA 3'-phosphate cyclase